MFLLENFSKEPHTNSHPLRSDVSYLFTYLPPLHVSSFDKPIQTTFLPSLLLFLSISPCFLVSSNKRIQNRGFYLRFPRLIHHRENEDYWSTLSLKVKTEYLLLWLRVSSLLWMGSNESFLDSHDSTFGPRRPKGFRTGRVTWGSYLFIIVVYTSTTTTHPSPDFKSHWDGWVEY